MNKLSYEQVRYTIFNIHDTHGIKTTYPVKLNWETLGHLVCFLGWFKDCIQQFSAFC